MIQSYPIIAGGGEACWSRGDVASLRGPGTIWVIMAEENIDQRRGDLLRTPKRARRCFKRPTSEHHFWTICRYFVSENMLTYCGIASSVTVLNSLGVPSPDAPQIYPYKMFTQENFFTDAVLQIRRPSRSRKERLHFGPAWQACLRCSTSR